MLALPARGRPGRNRILLEENLTECDGAIFVYGEASPEWIDENLKVYLRVWKRKPTVPVLGIFLGPPPDGDKHYSVKLPNMQELDGRNGVDDAIIQISRRRAQESRESDQSGVMAACPYPGLRPFEQSESHLFFGREEQVDHLLLRLQENRFLAVVGPSGCGKSSLVRAGLIPALKTGFMASAGPRWRFASMRPGN